MSPFAAYLRCIFTNVQAHSVIDVNSILISCVFASAFVLLFWNGFETVYWDSYRFSLNAEAFFRIPLVNRKSLNSKAAEDWRLSDVASSLCLNNVRDDTVAWWMMNKVLLILNKWNLPLSSQIRHHLSTLSSSHTLSSLPDKYVPVVTKLAKRAFKSQPRYNHGTHIAFRSAVRCAENVFRNTHCAVDWSYFKYLRNSCHSLILSSKKKCYSGPISSIRQTVKCKRTSTAQTVYSCCTFSLPTVHSLTASLLSSFTKYLNFVFLLSVCHPLHLTHDTCPPAAP